MKHVILCTEDLDPGSDPAESSSSSSSEGNKENSRPSSTDTSPQSKGLSRRQRKNRRRDDASTKKPKTKKNADPQQSHSPVKHYQKLHDVPEKTIYTFLHSYLLSREQMLSVGYPVDSEVHKGVIIFKSSPPAPKHSKVSADLAKFDVNAREFVPRGYFFESQDSGQGSSSDSGDIDSEESSTSSESSNSSRKFVERKNEFYTVERLLGKAFACARCKYTFYIREGKEYFGTEHCFYHTSRILVHQSVYPCCGAARGSLGCTVQKMHVWSGVRDGLNGPYDFVHTKPRRNPPADGNHKVYALDCEMIYTLNGMEVARVTVVGMDGRLVYDTFVKPENDVVDLNTFYSGITEKHLKSATKTLKDVQSDLMGFINADTILIGHGLENDLRVLKMVHYKVVDTAVTFPHYNGLPFRYSLKFLVSSHLKKEIQKEGVAHDSYEDSRACMDLMLLRVRKDFVGLIKHFQK